MNIQASPPSAKFAKNISPHGVMYWVALWFTVLTVTAAVYVAVRRTQSSAVILTIAVWIMLMAWGSVIIASQGRRRSLLMLNWIGGISCSLAFIIAAPSLLTASLLALIACVLWAAGIVRVERRALFVGSIVLVSTLMLICAIVRSALQGNPLIEPLLDQNEADVLSVVLSLTYLLLVPLQLQRLRNRIEGSLASLQSANHELLDMQQVLQQRLRERTQLLEMSRAIGSTMDLNSLLERMLMQILPVVPYGRAAVLLLRSNELVDIISIGDLQDIASTVAGSGRNQDHLAALRNITQPIIVSDLSIAIPDARYSFMAVPLIVRGKFIGILTLRHAQIGFYTPHDADLCMAFASQVAGMIDSTQLQEAAASAMVIAERHRLARELHDSISQSLYGIVLGTRTALQQLDPNSDAARAALEYSVSLASAALVDMRALIFALRPETLEQKGLIAALQAQIDLLQPHHSAQIHLDAPCGEPDATFEQKEALYRITAEALQNALRHSGGASVSIHIDGGCDGCGPGVEVVDDGCGFDPTTVYEGHLGLKTMRERADSLSGALCIHSSPGAGTRVSARLPRNRPKPAEISA